MSTEDPSLGAETPTGRASLDDEAPPSIPIWRTTRIPLSGAELQRSGSRLGGATLEAATEAPPAALGRERARSPPKPQRPRAAPEAPHEDARRSTRWWLPWRDGSRRRSLRPWRRVRPQRRRDHHARVFGREAAAGGGSPRPSIGRAASPVRQPHLPGSRPRLRRQRGRLRPLSLRPRPARWPRRPRRRRPARRRRPQLLPGPQPLYPLRRAPRARVLQRSGQRPTADALATAGAASRGAASPELPATPPVAAGGGLAPPPAPLRPPGSRLVTQTPPLPRLARLRALGPTRPPGHLSHGEPTAACRLRLRSACPASLRAMRIIAVGEYSSRTRRS
jgi:hypothetical protein